MNREEKKRAKREEIVARSLALFSEKGYDNTTTAEIAVACQIAKKTLFQYFPSKEDIIFENERELLEQILEVINDSATPWQTYLDWLKSLEQENEENLSLPALIRATPALHDRLLRMWAMYENEIAQAFDNSLSATILAAKIVLPWRLVFERDYTISQIIKELA
ncbi:TetR/AcrR family transcriptional regulator [Lactococcus nasutitermitis]|uniref:TetR/AcrR family transcriptional regulator n=1 Tax=Lactococcus nasutitermitis TaxID=1652957 RepID=A0ABV9JAE3_9LACT|nr:TetR/AcrR family transcriptional regulator [Lactococcus nasutitermitis]